MPGPYNIHNYFSHTHPLPYVPEHKLIGQHVDAGQLNIPPQQQPITLSLTKVTLD